MVEIATLLSPFGASVYVLQAAGMTSKYTSEYYPVIVKISLQ